VRPEPAASKGRATAIRIALTAILVAARVASASAPPPPGDLDRPLVCEGNGCERRLAAWQAMQRASGWMARFPPSELRFDAAVLLTGVRTSVDGATLRVAFEAARARADVDRDHPHRRFWDPAFRSPAKDTAAWTAPAAGAPRVNPNLVVGEALHCVENGWRRDTTTYVCGPMRDRGGYHTTHGLWALLIVRERGCIEAEAIAACVADLQAELVSTQPEKLRPERSLDVDLYGERLLMLLLSGASDPVVERSVDGLIAAQDSDGSFGVRVPGEDPYHRFHATAVATWALAEWQRRATSAPSAPSAGPTKTARATPSP
jgi:hypothetical protein